MCCAQIKTTNELILHLIMVYTSRIVLLVVHWYLFTVIEQMHNDVWPPI